MINVRSCTIDAPARASAAGAFPVIGVVGRNASEGGASSSVCIPACTSALTRASFRALVIAAVSVLITAMMCAAVIMLPEEAVFAADDTYETEVFDVDVDVTSRHVMSYEERITVNFLTPHHGIYRYIPIQKKFYDIRDIRVWGGDYSSSYDPTGEDENGAYGNQILQIGDADRVFVDEKDYRIQYSLVGTKDMDDDKDYLSLDLLPTGWQTPIQSSTITLTLPKEVDWDTVGLYTGKAGESSNVLDDTGHFTVEFGDDGKTLTIKAYDLAQGEGVTLQAELPEGYWEGVTSRRGLTMFAFLIPSMLALLMGMLWVTNGRDPDIVKPVEFYPPDDITPAEVGYIVDGKVDNKDLSSMLIYFASKGYLDIREKTKGSKKYELVKKKDIPDSEPTFAVRLFGGLFPYEDAIKAERRAAAKAKAKAEKAAKKSALDSMDPKTTLGKIIKESITGAGPEEADEEPVQAEPLAYEQTVDLDDLPDNFGDAVKIARDELQSLYDNGKHKMFTTGSKAARASGAFICALILPAALMMTNYVNYRALGIIPAVFLYILVSAGIGLISSSYDNRHSSARVQSIGKFAGGVAVCVFAAFIATALCAISCDGSVMIGVAIGAVATVALAAGLFFQVFMWARTKENALIYGKVLGFRNFIATAEHDRLKALSDENPEYYYNIMPYAMVMGMSVAWAKKFENLKVPEPDWYQGAEAADLGRAMWYNNIADSCSRQFVSTSSMIPDISDAVDSGGFFTGGGSISGGGFGGGSFSGGGFGGGGGGAW